MAKAGSNAKKKSPGSRKLPETARPDIVSNGVAEAPQRQPRPPYRKEGSQPVNFFLFVALVVGFAALLFGLVRLTGPMPSVRPDAVSKDGAAVPEALRTHKEFLAWLAAWKQADPYVSRSEFRIAEDRAIDADRLAASGIVPEEGETAPPRANRYAWSPDRSRFADFLSAYGGPDHAFRIWNRDGAGKIEMLEYCGTPCRYDGAFWLDDAKLVLLGAVEALKADGTPYCPGADEGEAACYQRLVATVYDFGSGRSQTYRSEPHLFRTDPFAKANRERWMSGLSPEEKIAAGPVDGAELIGIDGQVLSVVDGSLSVRGEDGEYVVKTFPKTTYRDEFGKPLEADRIRRGFTVRVSGLVDGASSLSATDVRVLKAPNVIVYEPTDGKTVGAAFTVTGIARTFEQNVRVRIRNAAGIVILDTHATADAPDVGVHGDFSLAVKIPKGKLVAGKDFTVDVFESSAKDGTDINKVSITLTYKP